MIHKVNVNADPNYANSNGETNDRPFEKDGTNSFKLEIWA